MRESIVKRLEVFPKHASVREGGLRYYSRAIYCADALPISILSLVFLLLFATSPLFGQTAPPQSTPMNIHINADNVTNRITPWMTGSCIEDVNHEIYGGLYAQLIFGESFEEPPLTRSPLQNWMAYGGQWRVGDDGLHVEADAGAKMIRDAAEVRDGVVECDLQFADAKTGNAALIVRVSNPRVGADTWTGYEISLSASDRNLALHRHRDDWHLLKTVPADILPGKWHHLRAELAGATFRVTLDNAPQTQLEYTDGADTILAGNIGLRSWNTNAAFRNLIITTAQGKTTDTLQQSTRPASADTISGMWDRVQTGNAPTRYTWDRKNPYNTAYSQRIEREKGDGIAGVANSGLNRWGIAVRKGQQFKGYVYLRRENFAGHITVALQSADGKHTYAHQEVTLGNSEWTRRDFTLQTNASDPRARFAIWIDTPGSLWIDYVELMPTGKDLFHGLPVRADIANALVKQGLTFLRYGGSMVNAPTYRWKFMLGPRDKRRQVKGWWNPQSSNGFGIEEFLQFCEAARIEPAFAINIDETPEDAADMVEYLTGSEMSRWGNVRIQNGHPLPYHIKYIEIGNEEAIDGNKDWYARYLERFKLLYAAMRARNPGLQFVIAAWWRPDEPFCKQIVQELGDKAALWDVHVGGDDLREGANVDRQLTQMRQLFQAWSPGTQLKACIFEENGGRHDLQRALGHAHILNVTQRHGDFVLVDCPANCLQPWLQNDNGWDQGQIFFTPDKVWGMPPFYAQQMAASNYQPLCVESRVENSEKNAAGTTSGNIDVTATRSEDGKTLVLHIVNIGSAAHALPVSLSGFSNVAPHADVWTLSGDLKAVNTPDALEQTRSVHSTLNGIGEHFTLNVAPFSYTVIRLRQGAK